MRFTICYWSVHVSPSGRPLSLEFVRLRTVYEIITVVKIFLWYNVFDYLNLLVTSLLSPCSFSEKHEPLVAPVRYIAGIWLISLGLTEKKKKRKKIAAPDTTGFWLLFPSLLTGLNYRSNTHLTSIRKTTLDLKIGMHIYPSWKI